MNDAANVSGAGEWEGERHLDLARVLNLALCEIIEGGTTESREIASRAVTHESVMPFLAHPHVDKVGEEEIARLTEAVARARCKRQGESADHLVYYDEFRGVKTSCVPIPADWIGTKRNDGSIFEQYPAIPFWQWKNGISAEADVRLVLSLLRPASAPEFGGKDFLRHLVDVVWGVAHEDESVPSTDWADRMIEQARRTYSTTETEK